jgi:hypothetical protein
MIILFSLLFRIFDVSACDFNSDIKSVYSLSGAVTLNLREFGLLANKKLLGISVFHPISKKEFGGRRIPGGIFLSHEMIKEFRDSIVFFDESRELKKIFSSYKNIKFVEINTRQKNPLQVQSYLKDKLNPFLSGCQFSKIQFDMESKLRELKVLANKKETFVFFLGLIRGNKLPEMLIVKDGVVKWLSEERLIKTYPSELAYVNWSARVMSHLPENTYRIGLKDSGGDLIQEIEKFENVINLTYPGSLIPGIGQVDAMIYLFKNL